MVLHVSIGRSCMERYPCAHKDCKITLTDGRKKTVSLGGDDIQTLIQAVRDKITLDFWGAEHFRIYNGGENVDSLLSRIFTN